MSSIRSLAGFLKSFTACGKSPWDDRHSISKDATTQGISQGGFASGYTLRQSISNVNRAFDLQRLFLKLRFATQIQCAG